MADHDPKDHATPGGAGLPDTAGASSGTPATILLIAVVMLAAILGLFVFNGGTPQSPQSVGTDTTDVIEPGAADGGADGGSSLQDNAAGTEADPAVQPSE